MIEYTKHVMHNTIAHHLLTDAQPIPELHCPWPTAPSLYTGHDVMWHGIPLWLVGVSRPVWVPSQLLVHSQPPLAGQYEKLRSP